MSERDENRLIARRREKLNALRERQKSGGGAAFPNDFRRNRLAAALHRRYGELDVAGLRTENARVSVAGRMMMVRVIGKSGFVKLRDASGDIQLFVRVDRVGEDVYREFKTWDVGDLVGAGGVMVKTKTGELSVETDELRLLAKSLRPLPEKFHGLTDVETRYRRRYLDLMMNAEARAVFETRSRIISFIRRYFDQRGFLEVETPMMQPLAGGAKARPFVTHHNALDADLYLRIAPELYLKRLVVGGVEKVYEINRNFRNEGVSSRHNPEFTMLEFYQAYADYRDLMDVTEDLLKALCLEVCGGTVLESRGRRFDFSKPFARVSVAEAVLRNNADLDAGDLTDRAALAEFAASKGVELDTEAGCGRLLAALFEKTVEHVLEEPTFVTAYPAEVSPLARRSDDDENLADRFELFIAGHEIANGFSELNDPDDQRRRFEEQMKERAQGDEEAMRYDEDYVTALEYGLPPAAGEGIGIDRLVMLLTGAESIRDVILFPQMRPKG